MHPFVCLFAGFLLLAFLRARPALCAVGAPHVYYKVSDPLAPQPGAAVPYQLRLRQIREERGLTQQQVAEVLGTSQTMYARYERGANELPLRHLARLAEYYGVSADYLLGRE